MTFKTELTHQEKPLLYALVADDDPIMREILLSLLTGAGYKVAVAANGREALQLASKTEVTIAFVDLAMPNGNGLQVCAALRRLHNWSTIPIIVLTQYSIDKALKAALSAGASGFLCKPLVHAELLWCLEVHVNKLTSTKTAAALDKRTDSEPVVRTIDITEEVLPPVDSKWILRHPPSTLVSRQVEEGFSAQLQPVTRDVNHESRPAVQSKVAQLLSSDHAHVDIDVLRQREKLFPSGMMARLLSKLSVSTKDVLAVLGGDHVTIGTDELRRLLHNLAGTAGTLGCGALSNAARELELSACDLHQHQQAFAKVAHATLEIIDYYINGSSNNPINPLLKFRILVVDDIAINSEIASAFLQAAGHIVTCVQSGAEAVAAVTALDFQVVLMDVRMPGMSGLEATQHIRALDSLRSRVPIVALTTATAGDQLAELHNAGMDDYLVKPFNPDTLIETVSRAALRSLEIALI